MYCFKSYFLVVVLIFVEKVASDCIQELEWVFNNHTEVESIYDYAYHKLAMTIVEWVSMAYSGEGGFAPNYMKHMCTNVDYSSVLTGSDFCTHIAEDKAKKEVTRQTQKGTRGLSTSRASHGALEDRVRISAGLTELYPIYKANCEQELLKHNFQLSSNEASFKHAFLSLTESVIPVEDTYATAYFKDIYSKTYRNVRALDFEGWCGDNLKFRKRLRFN